MCAEPPYSTTGRGFTSTKDAVAFDPISVAPRPVFSSTETKVKKHRRYGRNERGYTTLWDSLFINVKTPTSGCMSAAVLIPEVNSSGWGGLVESDYDRYDRLYYLDGGGDA